jgi:hypothetical protein
MPRRLLGGAATAAAVLLLSGCVAGVPASTATPVPEPTSVSTAPATPSAEPDPLATVTAIVARPEAIELRDAAGIIVEEFSYLDDPGPVVATITELLGADPVVEDRSGNPHAAPSTAHRWDAFTLWEQRREGGWSSVEYSIFSPRFRVEITGPSAFGVQLTTDHGVQVGGSWAELLAEPGLGTNVPCSGPYLDFVEVEGVDADGGAHVIRIGVDFRPTSDEATVARIGAPIAVSGGCA